MEHFTTLYCDVRCLHLQTEPWLALLFYDAIPFTLLSLGWPDSGLRFGGLAGWLGLTGGRLCAAVVVVVVVVVTGLGDGDGASCRTVGNECTRDPGWIVCPLGTLKYVARKPSEVTLWSDTNWTRRTLLLVTKGLEMMGKQKEKENMISWYNYYILILCAFICSNSIFLRYKSNQPRAMHHHATRGHPALSFTSLFCHFYFLFPDSINHMDTHTLCEAFQLSRPQGKVCYECNGVFFYVVIIIVTVFRDV